MGPSINNPYMTKLKNYLRFNNKNQAIKTNSMSLLMNSKVSKLNNLRVTQLRKRPFYLNFIQLVKVFN